MVDGVSVSVAKSACARLPGKGKETGTDTYIHTTGKANNKIQSTNLHVMSAYNVKSSLAALLLA